ncbi:MAG: hypothetical protein ACOX0B_03340 [Minisyncoccales bacterium]|jgi:hypothetical protein
MFRKTLEELLEMLCSYEDILGKDWIDEIETHRKENDPQKLKKVITEAFKKVASTPTRQLPFDCAERRGRLSKILYAAMCKL